MRGMRTAAGLLAASVIVGGLATGFAWAATPEALDQAAPQALKLGGVLNARQIGATAPKVNSPQAPFATATLFDSRTGATLSFTGSTPRTFMGSPFTLIDPLLTPIQITGATLYMVSVAAVTYTNVVANIQFYDVYAGAATPIYSSPTGGVQSFSLGAVSTAATTIYSIPVTFAAPITFAALADRGFAVSFQGDTGTGLAITDNLTSAIRYSAAAFAVGSSSVNGYYRNASARTDYNFASGDLRSIGQTNQGIAIMLQGNATFPVSLQGFDVK